MYLASNSTTNTSGYLKSRPAADECIPVEIITRGVENKGRREREKEKCMGKGFMADAIKNYPLFMQMMEKTAAVFEVSAIMGSESVN